MGRLEIRSDKTFPSYKEARAQFADSFVQRAAIAEATAARLEQISQGPIAGGEIDPAPVVKGLRDAAATMRFAAQLLQQLTPPTKDSIAEIVNNATAQIKKEFVAADPTKLTDPEWAFVDSLPGCDLDGQ